VDSFTLVVFLILIMFAVQLEQHLIAGALIVILVFALKRPVLIIVAVLGMAAGIYLGSEEQIIWLVVGVILIAVFVFQQKGEGPGAYSPGVMAVA
jgi:hypothetical protein